MNARRGWVRAQERVDALTWAVQVLTERMEHPFARYPGSGTP